MKLLGHGTAILLLITSAAAKTNAENSSNEGKRGTNGNDSR